MIRKKNKKGLANQILLLIIMAIVIIAIVVVTFIAQLTLPVFNSAIQDTNNIFQETMANSNNPALESAAKASFDPAAKGLNNMEWVAYTMFIVSILAFIIMCFYVRVYPFLIVIWIILIIFLVLISLYMANVYQDLRQDPTLGDYYTSWENTDFMLKNLPLMVLVIGIAGGIIMFVLASRSQEIEITGGGVPL